MTNCPSRPSPARPASSRPTIYRRWPSKAHLVFDAAFGQPPGGELLSPQAISMTDLRAFARAVLTVLA